MKNIKSFETYNEQVKEQRLNETKLYEAEEQYRLYLNSLNASETYRNIFDEFELEFENYVQMLHNGNPSAKYVYMGALNRFGERLKKYAVEYAKNIITEFH